MLPLQPKLLVPLERKDPPGFAPLQLSPQQLATDSIRDSASEQHQHQQQHNTTTSTTHHYTTHHHHNQFYIGAKATALNVPPTISVATAQMPPGLRTPNLNLRSTISTTTITGGTTAITTTSTTTTTSTGNDSYNNMHSSCNITIAVKNSTPERSQLSILSRDLHLQQTPQKVTLLNDDNDCSDCCLDSDCDERNGNTENCENNTNDNGLYSTALGLR